MFKKITSGGIPSIRNLPYMTESVFEKIKQSSKEMLEHAENDCYNSQENSTMSETSSQEFVDKKFFDDLQQVDEVNCAMIIDDRVHCNSSSSRSINDNIYRKRTVTDKKEPPKPAANKPAYMRLTSTRQTK